MTNNFYLYLIIMTGATYLIRVLPLTLFRKQIENPFIQSFLYYIPYVTLSVMIFPAILSATGNIISGIAALIVGIIMAWFNRSLFQVAMSCCIIVFIVEFFV